MKPILSLITLFIFLFTYSTKSSPLLAATPEPVVDISGEKLKAGSSYYVLPALRGRGGGLTYGNFGDRNCSTVVVQEKSEHSKGTPVQFFPENPKNRVVYTSRNLNIKFSEINSTCAGDSGVWRLLKAISEARNVAIDGVAGNQDIVNWFKIEKAELEGVYKLKFCPNLSACFNDDFAIFSYGDDGNRYVGATDPGLFVQTLRVVFQKAKVKDAIGDDADEAVMSI